MEALAATFLIVYFLAFTLGKIGDLINPDVKPTKTGRGLGPWKY